MHRHTWTLALLAPLLTGGCSDDDLNAQTDTQGEEDPRPDEEDDGASVSESGPADDTTEGGGETGPEIPDSGWRPGDPCLEAAFAGDHTIEFQDDRLAVGGHPQIEGTLRISSAELSELGWLSCLEIVDGDLQLSWNENLSSLAGLDALSSIGGNLRVRHNAQLSSLGLLETVSFGAGDVVLEHNPSLASLSGFASLESVAGDLVLHELASLPSLDDLSALTSVEGRLELEDNDQLADVSEFDDLNVGAGPVRIRGNEALDQCAAVALGEALVANGFEGDLVVENNMGECPPP